MHQSFDKLLDEGLYREVGVILDNFDHSTPELEPDHTLLQSRYYNDKVEADNTVRILSRYLLEHGHTVKVQIWFAYIEAIAKTGEIQIAKDYLEQLEQKTGFSTKNTFIEYEYLRLKLYIWTMIGDFEEAKLVDKKLKDVTDKLGTNDKKSKYFMQKARIYDFQGSLLPAIKYYKKAIDYGQKAGVIIDYLDPLHNLSNIYQYQGRYNLAIQGYKEELKLLEQMGFDFYHAIAENDLAWSYFLQGKDEHSIELLMKSYKHLQTYPELDILKHQAEVITRIIIVASYSQHELPIEDYLDELDNIRKRMNSPLVEIYYNVSLATILMLSNIFRNLAKALEIFETIVEAEKVIDIEFRLYSFLSIINILFQNYNYSNEEELLVEIQTWVEKIYNFADKQEAPSIKYQADWIKAKIKLARGERKDALKLLTSVLKKSDRHGFEHIANQVTKEIDNIDDDLEKAIDQTDFAYFRHDLSRKMLFSGQIQGIEEPQLFFIMGNSGLTIYSRHFASELVINENLISSFVNAIVSFGVEAMDHSESLKKIQYQQHQILIEPKSHYSIVFVIKGQSYPAQKKLLEFSKALDLPKYRVMLQPELHHIGHSQKVELDKLFETIFDY